jgi:hypothetical protein
MIMASLLKNDVKLHQNLDDLDIVINSAVGLYTRRTANVAVAGATIQDLSLIFTMVGQVFTAGTVWMVQGENPAGSKGTTFTGLPGVTYTFIVYDDTNCYYFYETAAQQFLPIQI